MSVEKEYIKIIKERFKSVKHLGDGTIVQLSDGDIKWKPNEESNNVAVIVKHVSGNMVSRWTDFLTTDGEKAYRNRDKEFLDDILSKEELIHVWEKGWNILFSTLEDLNEKDLLKTVTIRGEGHLVIEAIERQLAHYSYHVGQIVYIGKQVKNNKWESLSIPVGKSEDYLQEMLEKHRK